MVVGPLTVAMLCSHLGPNSRFILNSVLPTTYENTTPTYKNGEAIALYRSGHRSWIANDSFSSTAA